MGFHVSSQIGFNVFDEEIRVHTCILPMFLFPGYFGILFLSFYLYNFK